MNSFLGVETPLPLYFLKRFLKKLLHFTLTVRVGKNRVFLDFIGFNRVYLGFLNYSIFIFYFDPQISLKMLFLDF